MSEFRLGDLIQHPEAGDVVGVVTGFFDDGRYLRADFDGEVWSLDMKNCSLVADDWADERVDVLNRFTEELAKATGDGSKKRQAGTKPPWYEDTSHEGAMFSHLTKWKRGELVDPDSGGHPLVHLAWRALAIACRESGNIPPSQ